MKRKGTQMIHLYTGEGKGKTTAAIGLCIRAAGRNFHVCFSQFILFLFLSLTKEKTMMKMLSGSHMHYC